MARGLIASLNACWLRECEDLAQPQTGNDSIQIGDRVIGRGHPTFIVAEIGINHNGDMSLARECIAAAADAGADSVKFQNYRTEDFVSNTSLMFEYRSRGKTVTESQYALFKRCELKPEALADLKSEADRYGLDFHCTPTSVEGIRELQAIGCHILKNGSDYLTHHDLIRAMGETGLTTVLSTGMATLSEIDEAIRVFRETGNRKLVLLHCVSSYPAPPGDVNLSRLASLSGATGSIVGFSDHTAGTTAAICASVLGACWIEKHFTLDHNLAGPDHWFSAQPDEFKALVSGVREAGLMIGQPSIGPTESEMKGREEFRLSCVASRDLPEGHRLSGHDIAYRRPGSGVKPSQSFLLLDRVLRISVSRDHVFSTGDFID